MCLPALPPASCLQLLEAVTKFAVVRLAITGEALMDSCKSTADLLARNLLDSVGVWWFPGMILQVRGPRWWWWGVQLCCSASLGHKRQRLCG